MSQIKILGELKAINWGETIIIRDFDKFECHVNPYGNSASGIPNEDHRDIAKTIVNAVSNYTEVRELLKNSFEILTKLLNDMPTDAIMTTLNKEDLKVLPEIKKAINKIESHEKTT